MKTLLISFAVIFLSNYAKSQDFKIVNPFADTTLQTLIKKGDSVGIKRYIADVKIRSDSIRRTIGYGFPSFILDSVKLEIIERYHDCFSIKVCKNQYWVIFAFSSNPKFNWGLVITKNGKKLTQNQLASTVQYLKEAIRTAIKNKTLKKKVVHTETEYMIRCV